MGAGLGVGALACAGRVPLSLRRVPPQRRDCPQLRRHPWRTATRSYEGGRHPRATTVRSRRVGHRPSRRICPPLGRLVTAPVASLRKRKCPRSSPAARAFCAVRRTPVPTGFHGRMSPPGPLFRAWGAAQRPSITPTDDACVTTDSQPPKTTTSRAARGRTIAVATNGWRRPVRRVPNAAVYALRPCVRSTVRGAVWAMVPLLTELLLCVAAAGV